ncbi:MAG: flavin monoamine oxidase family protein [Rubrobacteraceae bacterium]
MSNNDFDAVIVGGGFAGVTVARELGNAGRNCLLLEARDRLGGRTWTAEFAGVDVELGGGWIHWLQPHVWAEVTRYGIEVTESPTPERCVWLADGERYSGELAEFDTLLNRGVEKFRAGFEDALEHPHDPLRDKEAIEAIDGLSAEDRLEKLELSPEERAILSGQLATNSHSPSRLGGLVSSLRWFSPAKWSNPLTQDAIARFKLKTGTRSLIAAIAEDAGAEIRLSTPVSFVEQKEDGVLVTTGAGEAVRARVAIVAVPLNTLGRIRFTPELSEGKRAVAAEGQASRGVKVWVRVKGELEKIYATAPDDAPFTWVQSEYDLPDGQLLVAFAPDAGKFDGNDPEQVASAVKQFLPEVEVIDTCAHDWSTDEFSLGTWGFLRPGQTSRYLRELQRPEGRVFLAGSDLGNLWGGFIDGAIESGLTTARQVKSLIRERRKS